MKYIDADKLIAELKRQKRELELSIQSQGDYGQSCHIVAYENILSLIDSLQQEQPEPFSCGHKNGYDEAYLQEKIAKASKTWEGVDVDKYLDEVRGREQEQPEVELEKASRNVYESWKGGTMDDFLRDMVELGKVLNARKEE